MRDPTGDHMSNRTRKPYRRLSRYPVPLQALVTESMAARISELADKAGWPASEVVRRALQAGLDEVEAQIVGEEDDQ